MKTVFVYLIDGSKEIFYVESESDGAVLDKYMKIVDKDGKVYFINHDQIVEIRIEEHVE